MSERVVTVRELNRATLARQLLLERHALTVPRAIERVCALQAQWPTAPYVALWSRVRDFRRDALTRALERRTVIRSTLMRTTIHMLSRADYLALATLWQIRRRSQHERDGGDVEVDETAARLALAGGERTYADLNRELGEAFSRRFGPLVPLAHVPPAGTWRHHGRTQLVEAECWLGATFGDARAAATLLVERYLRGYGPASLGDLRRFSGLPTQDLASGLETLEPRLRHCRDEEGRLLLDLARLPRPGRDTTSTAALPRPLGQSADRLRPAGTHSPGRVLGAEHRPRRRSGRARRRLRRGDLDGGAGGNRGDAAPGATRAAAADGAARGRDGGRDSPRVARARVRPEARAMELTQRELNRALLARQLLLERSRTPLVKALERTGGLQAQYAPSSYIGLWSRLDGFRFDALTRALEQDRAVQGTLLRGTIHVVSRADYWPFAEAIRRDRREQWTKAHANVIGGTDLARATRLARKALADGPRYRKELVPLVGGTVAWNGVELDLLRVPPSGTWEHRRADRYSDRREPDRPVRGLARQRARSPPPPLPRRVRTGDARGRGQLGRDQTGNAAARHRARPPAHVHRRDGRDAARPAARAAARRRALARPLPADLGRDAARARATDADPPGAIPVAPLRHEDARIRRRASSSTAPWPGSGARRPRAVQRVCSSSRSSRCRAAASASCARRASGSFARSSPRRARTRSAGSRRRPRRASARARARRAAPRGRPRRSGSRATPRGSPPAASRLRREHARAARLRGIAADESRYRVSCSTASIVATRLISTATQPSSPSRHIRSTGPTSVAHSRRTSRRPEPSASGRAASSTWRCASTPSFSSAAASPMSCPTSLSTSTSRISSRSSLRPARLRTTIRPGSSSITVGGVIQLSGL